MPFYDLQVDYRKSFVEGGSQNDWKSVICSKEPGHQRVGRRITDLFLDVLSWRVVDFSRTMLSDVVITDHALGILRSAQLTGFVVQPVQIALLPTGIKEHTLPKLWEFLVTGKGGFAHKDSGITKLRQCGSCGLVRYSAYKNGIIVDESVYDGSDFFTVTEYPKHILVSQRAKSVIETSRLTNVSFIESSKILWPRGVIKPEIDL